MSQVGRRVIVLLWRPGASAWPGPARFLGWGQGAPSVLQDYEPEGPLNATPSAPQNDCAHKSCLQSPTFHSHLQAAVRPLHLEGLSWSFPAPSPVTGLSLATFLGRPGLSSTRLVVMIFQGCGLCLGSGAKSQLHGFSHQLQTAADSK